MHNQNESQLFLCLEYLFAILFLIMCLWKISPRRRTLDHYTWGDPPIFICSHFPMKERKREAVYVSKVLLFMGSLEVPKHPWAHTLMWLSLRRTYKYMNLPYNLKPFRKIPATIFWWTQASSTIPYFWKPWASQQFKPNFILPSVCAVLEFFFNSEGKERFLNV